MTLDTVTDTVLARIALGVDGKWGDDVGHVRYDAELRRAFVVVQQLADPDSPNPNLLPPPGTAYLVEIDPIGRKIVTRMKLPNGCITPHGLIIDNVQHIGFVACIDASPSSIVRVDLQQMQVFHEPMWPVPLKPDILALDHSLHILYVACGAGIAIFQENGRALRWLGNYAFGVSTHTIAVNDQTHQVYLPIPRQGCKLRLSTLRNSGLKTGIRLIPFHCWPSQPARVWLSA